MLHCLGRGRAGQSLLSQACIFLCNGSNCSYHNYFAQHRIPLNCEKRKTNKNLLNYYKNKIVRVFFFYIFALRYTDDRANANSLVFCVCVKHNSYMFIRFG